MLYDEWATQLMKMILIQPPDEMRARLKQLFTQAHQNGKDEEIAQMGNHLLQRGLRIMVNGQEASVIKVAKVTQPDQAPSPPQVIPPQVPQTPSTKNSHRLNLGDANFMYVRLMSDNKTVDVVFRLAEDSHIKIVFPLRDQNNERCIEFPPNIPSDQRHICIDSGGTFRVPEAHEDFREPWDNEEDL